MAGDRTHYEGCWRAHHECAVAEVERLRADAREAARLLARAEAVREGLHALRERAERLEAIVRDLAAEEPIVTDYCEVRPGDVCGVCHERSEWGHGGQRRLIDHCEDCLWLRARQEVGDAR